MSPNSWLNIPDQQFPRGYQIPESYFLRLLQTFSQATRSGTFRVSSPTQIFQEADWQLLPLASCILKHLIACSQIEI